MKTVVIGLVFVGAVTAQITVGPQGGKWPVCRDNELIGADMKCHVVSVMGPFAECGVGYGLRADGVCVPMPKDANAMQSFHFKKEPQPDKRNALSETNREIIWTEVFMLVTLSLLVCLIANLWWRVSKLEKKE